MSAHFIREITINGYKCLNNFHAKGFGRVNLISGKNNAGKSIFLESIFINSYHESTLNTYICLYHIFQIRNVFEYINTGFNTVDFLKETTLSLKLAKIKSSVGSIEIKHINDSDNYEIANEFAKHTHSISDLNNTAIDNYNQSYICGHISAFKESQNSAIQQFSFIQYQDLEGDLVNLVKEIDASIENIKIIDDSIQCRTSNNGVPVYRNINSFGDGFKQFLFIIISLYSFKDGYLLIDEIDNGIHYSVLDQMWKIVLTLSKKNNIQVFATTHSLECIQSYARVSEKLEDRDITFTTLVKNKEKQIKAIVHSYEIFTSSLADGNEVRGW